MSERRHGPDSTGSIPRAAQKQMMTGLIEPQVEPANDKTVIVRWPLGMYLEIRKETGLEEEVFLPEYVVAFALKPVERGEMKAKDK